MTKINATTHFQVNTRGVIGDRNQTEISIVEASRREDVLDGVALQIAIVELVASTPNDLVHRSRNTLTVSRICASLKMRLYNPQNYCNAW